MRRNKDQTDSAAGGKAIAAGAAAAVRRLSSGVRKSSFERRQSSSPSSESEVVGRYISSPSELGGGGAMDEPQQTLEARFAELLQTLGLPKEKREAMLQMPLDKKREMLKMYTLHQRHSSTEVTKTATDHVDELRAPRGPLLPPTPGLA